MQIAAEFGYSFCIANKKRWKADIVFANNSRFSSEVLAGDFRGVHLIRDPRDIVLSGMRYHLDAAEGWLHKPDKELDGQSYQQVLNGLSKDQQFNFELKRTARDQFKDLLAWNYEDPRFYELRYEDLMTDRAAVEFRNVLTFFAMPEDQIEGSCRILKQNSLFNENARMANSRHIRDGRVRQWATQMTRSQGESFAEVGGDLLIALGYEPNYD